MGKNLVLAIRPFASTLNHHLRLQPVSYFSRMSNHRQATGYSKMSSHSDDSEFVLMESSHRQHSIFSEMAKIHFPDFDFNKLMSGHFPGSGYSDVSSEHSDSEFTEMPSPPRQDSGFSKISSHRQGTIYAKMSNSGHDSGFFSMSNPRQDSGFSKMPNPQGTELSSQRQCSEPDTSLMAGAVEDYFLGARGGESAMARDEKVSGVVEQVESAKNVGLYGKILQFFIVDYEGLLSFQI